MDRAGPLMIVGESGQLAIALKRAEPHAIALGRTKVDITAAESVNDALDRVRPSRVINASAYTGVDKAETEQDAAMALNAHAPGVLAQACAIRSIPFVHVSTDYVFNGRTGAPYQEDDPTDPVNFYGQTKELGERAVRAAGEGSSIIRTSWVFSDSGVNFVKTMLRLAETREEIGVVSDQIGRPTSASDLADACLAVAADMRRGGPGRNYHFANLGETSWAGLAEAVMRAAAMRGSKSARIRPIATSDYPTPACRPRDSRLAIGRIEALMGKPIPHWISALENVCDALIPGGGQSGN
jgi:dTDP-4-dehydrorhamnose reductase